MSRGREDTREGCDRAWVGSNRSPGSCLAATAGTAWRCRHALPFVPSDRARRRSHRVGPRHPRHYIVATGSGTAGTHADRGGEPERTRSVRGLPHATQPAVPLSGRPGGRGCAPETTAAAAEFRRHPPSSPPRHRHRLRTTGFGLVDCQGNRMTAVDCGIITTSAKLPFSECLRRLAGGIRELVKTYAPDQAVIEGAFFSRNVHTAMMLGSARGAVIAALAELQDPMYEYAPRRVKQSVCGFGNASKPQVAPARSPVAAHPGRQPAGRCHRRPRLGHLPCVHLPCRRRRGGAGGAVRLGPGTRTRVQGSGFRAQGSARPPARRGGTRPLQCRGRIRRSRLPGGGRRHEYRATVRHSGRDTRIPRSAGRQTRGPCMRQATPQAESQVPAATASPAAFYNTLASSYDRMMASRNA